MQRATVDLPDPLSPTSASVSPATISRSTPSTATSRRPPSTGKTLLRSRTCRSGWPSITPPRPAGSPTAGAACSRSRGVVKIASALPVSTTRPAFITTTSSQVSATTPRSCVIRQVVRPRVRLSSTISSMMSDWIVTSSPVVGSSRIRSDGWQISDAMAIIARCAMPPENSCGYCRARRSGSGMETFRSASIACFIAALRPPPCWSCQTSASWRPTVNTGLRAARASWKTMLISAPRMRRIPSRRGRADRCRGTAMRPPLRSNAGGWMPRIDSATSDLPLPDSPTTAVITPVFRRYETPCSTGMKSPTSERKPPL